MAVSIAQYVDLLFKKLQGVAKTANSTVKSASNESIASPAFLRGDIVWMQSDQIPATAQAVSGIANARINGNSVQCVADTTVPPVGGIYPTWLSNVPYWIPQELGATWLPKVFVGPAAAANIQATGTQIFAAGIGGVGEYYFDTQAGVLNFIGETIPTVLTAGNVVYISGYEYTGAIGVTNQPGNVTIGNLSITSTTSNRVLYTNNDNFVVTSNNLTFDGSLLDLTGTANVSANVSVGNLYSAGLINAVGNVNGTGAVFSGNITAQNFIGNIIGNSGTVGNLTFGNTTISTSLVNGNITLAATGNSFVQIGGTYGFVVPVGNTAQRLATGNLVGTVRFNTDASRIEVYDGTEWDQIVAGVTNQVLYGDGSTETFTLDRSTTTAAVLVILNGITQVPVQSYSMVPSPSTNLVFTEAPEPGDVIDIRFL
jgi:hypothetical protein